MEDIFRQVYYNAMYLAFLKSSTDRQALLLNKILLDIFICHQCKINH